MLGHTPGHQPVFHKEKLRLAEAENSQGHTLNDLIHSNPFLDCSLLSMKYALESSAFGGFYFLEKAGIFFFKVKTNYACAQGQMHLRLVPEVRTSEAGERGGREPPYVGVGY